MTLEKRLLFVAVLLILTSVSVFCSPTHAQSAAGFQFNSINVTVDIASPKLAHVTREVSILFQSGNWTYLDWGLWYQGKTVTMNKVFDNEGTLGFVYPTPGSPTGQPVLRILFSKTFMSGEVYNFTYAFDVSSDQDSFTWSETLDSSQVLIQSLSVTIKLPTGYNPTGVQPSSATVTQEQDGRNYITWTGTNLSGLPSVGLSLGFNHQSTPSIYDAASLLPYAGAVAAFASLGLYGVRRFQTSKKRRVEPEVILEGKAREAAAQAPCETVPTGLPVLDYLLKGGLPIASATLLTSPASDETREHNPQIPRDRSQKGGTKRLLNKGLLEGHRPFDLIPEQPAGFSYKKRRPTAKASEHSIQHETGKPHRHQYRPNVPSTRHLARNRRVKAPVHRYSRRYTPHSQEPSHTKMADRNSPKSQGPRLYSPGHTESTNSYSFRLSSHSRNV